LYRIYLGDEVVAAPAGDAGVPDGGEQLLAVRVCHELRTTTHTAINLLLTPSSKLQRRVPGHHLQGPGPEMDVGPFFFTQPNPTHQLMDPNQPTHHTPT